MPALRSLQPGPSGAFERAVARAWEATDAALLELCRLRVAALLRDDRALAARTPAALAAGFDEQKARLLDDWPAAPSFTAAERAFLDFTEQFVTSVGDVSGTQVEALLEHTGPREVWNFVSALYVVEFAIRLDLAARALLDGDDGG